MRETEMWNRMRRMQEEIDRIFENFFGSPAFFAIPGENFGSRAMLTGKTSGPLAERSQLPLLSASADLYETDKAVVAKLDLPGVDKKDIELEVGEDALSVSVEKKSEREEKGKGTYLSERAYSGYCRTLPLPPYVKGEEAKAEYKDGVLTVEIPKDEVKTKGSRKIEVA